MKQRAAKKKQTKKVKAAKAKAKAARRAAASGAAGDDVAMGDAVARADEDVKIVVLSADAPAGEEVKCPAAPEDRAGIIGELDGDGLLGDDELMEASGAVAAHELRKQ